MFTALEKQRTQLGVASYGVSVTTMEEVFLKVGEEIDKLMADDNTGLLRPIYTAQLLTYDCRMRLALVIPTTQIALIYTKQFVSLGMTRPSRMQQSYVKVVPCNRPLYSRDFPGFVHQPVQSTGRE